MRDRKIRPKHSGSFTKQRARISSLEIHKPLPPPKLCSDINRALIYAVNVVEISYVYLKTERVGDVTRNEVESEKERHFRRKRTTARVTELEEFTTEESADFFMHENEANEAAVGKSHLKSCREVMNGF